MTNATAAPRAGPHGDEAEEQGEVRALKRLVRGYLRRAEFKGRVRTALTCPAVVEGAEGAVTATRRRTAAEAIEALRREGVVEELTKLAMEDAKRPAAAPDCRDGPPCILKVHVSRAGGFDGALEAPGARLEVCVMWCGQRRWSAHAASEEGGLLGVDETHFFDVPGRCSRDGYVRTDAPHCRLAPPGD